jgi:hypothetical protein
MNRPARRGRSSSTALLTATSRARCPLHLVQYHARGLAHECVRILACEAQVGGDVERHVGQGPRRLETPRQGALAGLASAHHDHHRHDSESMVQVGSGEARGSAARARRGGQNGYAAAFDVTGASCDKPQTMYSRCREKKAIDDGERAPRPLSVGSEEPPRQDRRASEPGRALG